MIRKLNVSLLALVALVSIMSIVCSAQSQTLMTRNTREAVLSGEAKPVGRLPASQSMRFDIVLALRHQPELENFLQAVYDPSSSSYQQFVTPQEFTARFGPSQEDFDAVMAFVKASGFTVTGGSRDALDIRLTGTVAEIEKAFHVTMGVYQHPTENRTFYAPDREPTADVAVRLWHISGLDNYSLPRPLVVHNDVKAQPLAVTGSCPQQSFCGSDMRAAYYGGSLTGSGQNIGLLEFLGFDIADVNTYYKNAGQTRNFAVTGISTDGSSVNCVAPGCDDTEQTLDITQAGGMAPNVTTVYLYVSNSSDTAMLSAMSTDTPLPLNLSSSWTWSPADPSQDDPFFQKMATQGQSFFQASGDSGAYRGSAPWPANSQYVIAVGGTDLETQSAGGPWKSETAWVDGGGGYGTNVAIPSWQQLAGVITAANEGSTHYRNVPDVSANANFTFYVCADQTTCSANNYGGTSFAAPMWAGYLALANQQAVISGKAAPGFIDPVIYPLNLGNSDADFHDIISGSDGFPTEPGYDLATGWGSPNGSNLINDLLGAGGGGGGPAVSLSPTSLKWGKIVVDVTSNSKAVTVTNSGSATLDITSIAASGDFAIKAFKATKTATPCGSTLAAGASCVVKVTFTPTQTGTRTGDLTFTDNAPSSPQQVTLTGKGE